MPFSSLHAVELQLVMQCCDKLTLLQLARCGKDTLAAASCDFAFKFVSPVSLDSHPDLASLLAPSLLRFCDVSLTHAERLANRSTSGSTQSNPLSQMPRVTSITMSGQSASIAALAELPRLSTLRIQDIPPTGLQTSALRDLPALTELHFPDFFSAVTRAYVGHIADCPKLHNIDLTYWSADHTLALMVAMSDRLRSLSLHNGVWFPQSASTWTAALSSLSVLESLTLSECTGVLAVVLLAVEHCRALRVMILRRTISAGTLSLAELQQAPVADAMLAAIKRRHDNVEAGQSTAMCIQLWNASQQHASQYALLPALSAGLHVRFEVHIEPLE